MRGRRTVNGQGTAANLITLADEQTGVLSMNCGLVAGLDAAAVVRSHAREYFHSWLPVDVIGDLELVLTELVANASAASRPGDPMAVVVRMSTDELLIEVTDLSEAPPKQRLAGDLDENGRGLLLVDALTRCWGWRLTGLGKVVWGVLPVRPPDGPGSAGQ